MDNLFDEVLSLLNAELTEREITVDVLLPHSLNNVHVDRVQIEQVLVNLVHNSVDAIGECPTAPRRLELAARDRDDRFVEVQVRDFGPGMTDDVAAKAFEAFYSTKSKGMGMGLAICRTIVEAHGGRIEMAPNRGAGVTCSFTLPIFEELPSCPTTMKHSSVS
jgi:signal transduction histidine kinase